MNLAEFRLLTRNIPESTELIFEAGPSPLGNCWAVHHVVCTAIGSFGRLIPALKFIDAREEGIADIYIGQEGDWAKGLIDTE